jgi:parvulin-like peptidyl-prolyl isomerase
MITKKRIVLAVGALALVAAACSSPDVAATVNDSEILESFVLSIRVVNEGRDTVSAEQYRNDLSRLIFTEAMLTAAEEDFGLTDLDTPEARDAFLATSSVQDQSYLTTVAQDAELSDVAVDVAVTQLLLRSEVRRALAADEANIQDVWQNDQAILIEVCARHILVATENESSEVLARLDAGDDFAFIAAEVSLDTTSPGGVLPCPVSPASFVGSFAAVAATAPVGELVGPVETGFGWHIIIVDSRESPASLEELAADPVRWMPDDALDSFWNVWLNDVVERADIVVRSDIGMWYPPVDGIIPPPPSP